MTLSNSIKATIHPEGYVEIHNGQFTKKISIKDYASVISSLVGEEDQATAGSTIRYPSSVHSVTNTNQGHIVNLYYPEREAEMRHTGAGKHMMYLPNIMIRVELRNVQGKEGEYSLGSIYWFATDKERVSLPVEWPSGFNSRDHIWTLPFPNMFNSGTMCTGGNRLPSVIYNDWTVLDMLYNDVLIRSPFNNDLSVPNLAESMCPGPWIQRLGAHYLEEDTERFPYNLLVNY